jgi:hypothetical protein
VVDDRPDPQARPEQRAKIICRDSMSWRHALTSEVRRSNREIVLLERSWDEQRTLSRTADIMTYAS